jgi:hypothetical protein
VCNLGCGQSVTFDFVGHRINVNIRQDVTTCANLLLVLLIPTLHLELQISSRIFEKNLNGATGMIRGSEEAD